MLKIAFLKTQKQTMFLCNDDDVNMEEKNTHIVKALVD